MADKKKKGSGFGRKILAGVIAAGLILSATPMNVLAQDNQKPSQNSGDFGKKHKKKKHYHDDKRWYPSQNYWGYQYWGGDLGVDDYEPPECGRRVGDECYPAYPSGRDNTIIIIVPERNPAPYGGRKYNNGRSR
jgi:hypothetical protein